METTKDLAGKILGIEFNQPLLCLMVGIAGMVFSGIYNLKTLEMFSLIYSIIMALLSIAYIFHLVKRYWQRPKP